MSTSLRTKNSDHANLIIHQDLIMDVVKLTDRIMVVDFVLSDTLPAVLSAVVVRKYERPSVTLRSVLLKVSNSTASRIASFKFWGRSSWLDYKSHFNACSRINQWSENEKGLYLAVALHGQAQGILGDLPIDKQQD
jgi:hypothetical protein